MLDDDLLIGYHNPLHDQSQHALAGLKGWFLQDLGDALAERRNRVGPLGGVLGLGDLGGDELFPLVGMLLGLPQALAPLFELVEFDSSDLIGVDEALFLPLQARLLAPQALEFPFGIRHVRAFTGLLVANLVQDEVRLLEQLTHGGPDDRLDIGLTHAPQVAAPLEGF
jgi:hypothetical protein